MAEVDLSELERYLRIFQENPDSRVFAPLADLYRRLGRLGEAEEICREGIRRHPYYAGGRVSLAHILLDQGDFDQALQEADAVVTYYPDNLLARKILVRVLGAKNEITRARRELEALRAMAPLVAEDPELQRALQGPAAAADLPQSPRARAREEIFKPIEIQEKTEWDAFSPELDHARIRSKRMGKLLRQKLVLEGLLQKLEL